MIEFFEFGGNWITYNSLNGLSVNGKSVDYTHNAPSVFVEKPTLVQRITKRKVESSIIANGVTVSSEAHRSRLNSLLEKYNDEYDRWDSLEDEFEYRKYLDSVEIQYEDVTTTEDIEFVIKTIDVTLDVPPYCVPMRLVNAPETIKEFSLWRYSPRRLDMAVEIGGQYDFNFIGIDEKTNNGSRQWTLPYHSAKDLQFIKIGASYADYKPLAGIKSVIGTIEECIAAHENNLKLLHEFWSHEDCKVSPVVLGKHTVGEITKKLDVIQSMLERVTPKQSSRSDYFDTIRLVRELKSYVGDGVKR